MVTEVDHHSVKTRIKEILQANATVYDPTGSPGKLVDCFVGRPYNNAISAHTTPYAFITNDDNLEEMSAEGVVQNDTTTATLHDVKYLIVMVDQAQDGRQVERNLDDIGKNLIQVLKANFELRKPTDSTDPKCSYSFPVRVNVFDTTSSGKPLQGRIIHMKLLIHTS